MGLHMYHQWHVIFQFEEDSAQFLSTARQLRSTQCSVDQLFALYRFPPRSKVRKLTKNGIKFKGTMLPAKAKPSLIPVSAHSTCKTFYGFATVSLTGKTS